MANLDFVLIKEIYYLFSIFAAFLVYWQYFKIRILIDSIAACEIDIKIRESEHFKEQKNFSQSYFKSGRLSSKLYIITKCRIADKSIINCSI